MFTIAIADANGQLIAANRPNPHGSIADQPFFRAQRERTADGPMPFVSTVAPSRSGAPEITFSRRLSNADGSLAGIVTLAADPGYFTSGYDYSRMGNEGMLALVGSDGVVRAAP